MRHDIPATSDSYPYVTGMGFRNRSHFIFDEFRQDGADNITHDGQVVFIKTDLVPMFFANVMPKVKHSVKIITHNSAIGIDLNHLQFLDNRMVDYWYAQNANIRHEKLIRLGWQTKDGSMETLMTLKMSCKAVQKNNIWYT